MFFWGVAYIISTTLVALFKKENSLSTVENEQDIDLNIRQSYQLLWEILKLKPVQRIAVVLLTVKVSHRFQVNSVRFWNFQQRCKIVSYIAQLGFSAIDAVSPLKLVENGVPKDRLALLAIPLVPMQIILPFLISKYMVGPRPMDCYLSVIPLRWVLIKCLVKNYQIRPPHCQIGFRAQYTISII